MDNRKSHNLTTHFYFWFLIQFYQKLSFNFQYFFLSIWFKNSLDFICGSVDLLCLGRAAFNAFHYSIIQRLIKQLKYNKWTEELCQSVLTGDFETFYRRFKIVMLCLRKRKPSYYMQHSDLQLASYVAEVKLFFTLHQFKKN